MAHLISHHDPYHIHKTLGLLVLLHYLYRFYLAWTTGTAFPSSEPTSTAIASVLLHGLLSWSSLLLPLPQKRNLSKPMIWPEFRLHSIVFATRHVVTTVVTLLDLWPDDRNVLLHFLARAAVVLGTVRAASFVTDRYGDRNVRTTNMMPYESHILPAQQTGIKRLYTSAQFGSTVTSLMSDPGMTFAPLLGIQMAPLLMTLVRKGKVGTAAYHRIYSASLTLGYALIFLRMLDLEYVGVDTFRAFVLFSLPFRKSRRYVSAEAFWTVTIAFATIAYPLFLQERVAKFASVGLLRNLVWFAMVKTLAQQILTYAPLFVTMALEDGPSSDIHHRAMCACKGVICSTGLRVSLCSIGIFWLIQCCSPAGACST